MAEKLCAKCGCSKPHSEFGANGARKDGVQTYCRTCTKQYMAAKAYDKVRWVEHKGAESERNKKYRMSRADTLKPVDRARSLLNRKLNPGRVRAHNIARKHGEKRATPVWADMGAINAIYAEAKSLEAKDGIRRHVDHEIPLKHKLVCGLHVQSNLRVLTAAENMSKHNRFD
jgi:hypothetical protein